MNPLKSELKILLANNLGADIEDSAEAYERDQYRHEGAAVGAQKVIKAIQALSAHVSKDLDEGKFSDFPEPIVAAKLIKDWLGKAIEAASGVGAQAEASKIHSQGKVAGVRAIIEALQKQNQLETRKLQQYREAEEAIEEEGTEADLLAVTLRPRL